MSTPDLPSDPLRAKQAWRREVRARLREIDAATRAEASLLICESATHLPEFARAGCVALFVPLPTEPDIRPLIEETWAQRKRVALPRMELVASKPRLNWHAASGWDEVVEVGPFGLHEPDPARCPILAASEITCAFIPGLAFDAGGYRLGRGGGYYDSFLAEAPAGLPCLGLMFACQEIDAVPREPHDQRLRGVLTEKELRTFE